MDYDIYILLSSFPKGKLRHRVITPEVLPLGGTGAGVSLGSGPLGSATGHQTAWQMPAPWAGAHPAGACLPLLRAELLPPHPM